MTKDILFKNIWDQYTDLTPQAKEIQNLLKDKGETVLNDHVAYRSIAINGFGLKDLCVPFLELGYEIKDDYKFEVKKLDAVHLESSNIDDPKVFISELRVKDLSKEAQKIFESALYYTEVKTSFELLTSGCFWESTYENYKTLANESEYAAWF